MELVNLQIIVFVRVIDRGRGRDRQTEIDRPDGDR
jgi:hypothetical protein